MDEILSPLQHFFYFLSPPAAAPPSQLTLTEPPEQKGMQCQGLQWEGEITEMLEWINQLCVG